MEWVVKFCLIVLCTLSATYDYYNSKYLIQKYGTELELNSWAQHSMFTAIAGPTIFWAMVAALLPNPVPLAFYTGMRIQLFYTQRLARVILNK